MSATTTENGKGALEQVETAPETGVERRLGTLETEVRDQGKAIRHTARGFTIFALFALLIAAANLLVVAAKLDKKSSSSGASAAAPAAAPTSATPAAPANPGKIGVSLKEFTVNPTAAQAPA